MTASDDCLFCSIVAGDIPGDMVLTTEDVVAFRDLNPVAPTHVLVVPRDHAPNAAATAADDPALLGMLVRAAAEVAAREGNDDYRPVLTPAPGSARACSTPISTCWVAGR